MSVQAADRVLLPLLLLLLLLIQKMPVAASDAPQAVPCNCLLQVCYSCFKQFATTRLHATKSDDCYSCVCTSQWHTCTRA
jgi:hypothetical protein